MANRSKVISNSIAARIRELRINHGYTQKELSELLFKSESTVRMWELGKSEPDIGTIVKLAKCLEVSLEYLLGVSDKPSIDEQHVLEVAKYFLNEEKPADEGELSEDVVIYHRDGKSVTKHFTKEQMDMLVQMIEAIPEKPKDI